MTILGVISQLRLWNIVRARRAKERERQDEEQRLKDEAEAEAGRRLEESNIRERSEWEAMYGRASVARHGSMTDCGEVHEDWKTNRAGSEVGGFEKGEAIEMENVESPSQGSYRCPDCRERDIDDGSSMRSPKPKSSQQHDQVEDESSIVQTPPSFRAFDGTVIAARMKDDNESVVTANIGSDTGSKHFSGRSLLRRLSKHSRKQPSQSEEALVSPDDGESDANSSAQVVMDEGSELGYGRSSVASDSYRDSYQVMTERAFDETGQPSAEEAGAVTQAGEGNDAHERSEDTVVKNGGIELTSQLVDRVRTEKALSGDSLERANSQEEVREAGAQDADSEPVSPGDVEPDTEEKKSRKSLGTARSEGVTTERKSRKATPQEEPVELNSETVKQLPKRSSKVIQSYRTNEWAKHLSDADFPEPEPIAIAGSEQQPEKPSTGAKETAAPVNTNELLQTPLNAQPPPAVEPRVSTYEPTESNEDRRMSTGSRLPSKNVRQSQPRLSAANLSRVPSANSLHPSPTPPLSRASSPSNLHPSPSAPQLPSPSRESRNLSNPYLPEAIHEELSEEAERTSPAKPKWNGPPPLLAVREGMVRNRLSSTSLNRDPWSSRNSPGLASFESLAQIPQPTTPIPEEEEDDLPLSQRRNMLHQQNRHNPAVRSSRSFYGNNSGNNNKGNSQAVMAAWRQSVREELSQNQDPLSSWHGGLNTAGGPAYDGKPQSSSPARSPYLSQQRHSSMNLDNANMQRGSMGDLHREAMRRMQASANRHVNGSHG